MAYMPSFFAWLFRPAFKDNKVISSFSTFLRLLLSFFDIPRIISQFSESLAALRIASLVSASLLLLLSVFSLSIFSCFLFNYFSCSLFFLSHLTFPAYLSLVSELLLFSFLSLLQLFSISSLVLFSFSSHLISCSLFLLCSLLLFFFSESPDIPRISFSALPLSSDRFRTMRQTAFPDFGRPGCAVCP